MRKTRSICGFILLLMSAVAHGHYTNTSPDSVHACVSKTTRVVRIVGSGATAVCAAGERAMHWAVTSSTFRGHWNQASLYNAGDVVLLPGFNDSGASLVCVYLAATSSQGEQPAAESNQELPGSKWTLLAPDECRQEIPDQYDLASAMTPAANPAGPWSIGWVSSLAADISLFSTVKTYPDGFSWGGTPAAPDELKLYGWFFKNTSSANQVTLGPTVNLGPGALLWFPVVTNVGGATAVRFIAPGPGSYAFNVVWGGGNGNTCRGGPNVIGYVRHNLNLLKQINLQPYNVNASASFTETLSLNGGDKVDFLLANPQGYDGNCQFTGLSASATRQ